jgi:hypothetical protein
MKHTAFAFAGKQKDAQNASEDADAVNDGD